MKRLLTGLFVAIFSATSLFSQTLFPDFDAEKSDVEIGVEGIQRICPTGMWDHWIFRDIIFDRDSKTVVLVIQLNSWSERKEKKSRQITGADVLKETEWIIANFKTGYEEIIKNPSIRGDGDFMLYLSLGTLFKQMEKEGTNLRIMLLKPDYANQVFSDIPFEVSSEQLKEIKAKE